jgi:hypothetical protein
LTGIQKAFFNCISPENGKENPLANLKNLFVSMQLPLQLALSPAELALSVARRLPKLEWVAIAAPKKSSLANMSIWDLGGMGGHPPGWGMSGGELKVWEVRRVIAWRLGQGEDGEVEQLASIVEISNPVY